MAYPMVHLLVARGYAAHHPALMECPEYYLGAVAPDAVHVRPDARAHADKRAAHLGVYGKMDGLAQVRAYWQDVGRTPFDIGYGIHILTDRHWVAFYRQAFPGLINADDSTNAARYRPDAAWIDAALYRDAVRHTHIPTLLAHAQPPGAHPLLTEAELLAWRGGMLETMRDTQAMPDGAPVWMRYEAVRAYADSAGDALHTLINP